jgi:hypothetical protein
MPGRVDRKIASASASFPRVKLVYVEAVREDSYFLSQENGRPVLYVHPMHRAFAEALQIHSDAPAEHAGAR